jgi:hypothetical protein
MQKTARMYGVLSPRSGTLATGVFTADRKSLGRVVKGLPKPRPKIVPLTVTYRVRKPR